MRLLYDLDGNIAHFDLRYDEYLDADYPHFSHIRSANQKTFNLWADRTPDEQDAIRDIMNRAGFYKDMKPIDGAVDAVKEAQGMGHEVFFLSAPWITNSTCASDKYDWIEKIFGEGWGDKLILAKDKTVVSGDVLFDDKDPIPHKERADWTQVFFDQPYNREAEGLRILSWEPDQWKPILEQIEEEKAKKSTAPDGITIPLHLMSDIRYISFPSKETENA